MSINKAPTGTAIANRIKVAVTDGEEVFNSETSLSSIDSKLSAAITVTVGSGGDYATINAAISGLENYRMDYTNGGLEAEISLLTGFTMSEQVVVVQKDLSWITIRSVDATVTIARSALVHLSSILNVDILGVDGTTKETRITNAAPAFAAIRSASLPNIGVLFNMDTSGSATGFDLSGISGDRHGILVAQNSRAYILPKAGVTSASGRGLYLIESQVSARWAIFNSAATIGFRAANNSSLDCRQGSATSCGEHGLALDGGNRVLARDGDFSSATGNCIEAVNANILDARGANGSSSGARGAHILASWVDLDGANLSSATTEGLYCADAAHVNADSVDVSSAGATGIRVLTGAHVNANSADADPVSGTNAVYVSAGGYLNFSNGFANSGGGAGTSADVRVGSGGVISAASATGTLSQTANTIAAAGIIFQ